jgi:hypothetical protein
VLILLGKIEEKRDKNGAGDGNRTHDVQLGKQKAHIITTFDVSNETHKINKLSICSPYQVLTGFIECVTYASLKYI